MVLSDYAKNAMLQGLATALNSGTNSVFSVYVGEVLAAEIALPNPVELTVAAGVLTFKTPPEALAVASGVPTTAKLSDFSGALVADFDVANEVVLDKAQIYQGGYVGLQSLKISI